MPFIFPAENYSKNKENLKVMFEAATLGKIPVMESAEFTLTINIQQLCITSFSKIAANN